MSDSRSEKTEARRLRDVDVDEIVRQNPAVDEAKLRDARRVLDRLRREGIAGPTYRIVSPYERRPRRDPSS
jgi:hypothetical protein